MEKPVKAIIVRADATSEYRTLGAAERTQHEEISEVVGGWLEGIFTKDAVVYVDEEGIAKQLPPNVLATVAVRGLLQADGRDLLPGDVIKGTAVFLGFRGEDHMDIPQKLVEKYFNDATIPVAEAWKEFRTRVAEICQQQGWNDSTLVTLVEDFVHGREDNVELLQQFEQYLRGVAKTENDMAADSGEEAEDK